MTAAAGTLPGRGPGAARRSDRVPVISAFAPAAGGPKPPGSQPLDRLRPATARAMAWKAWVLAGPALPGQATLAVSQCCSEFPPWLPDQLKVAAAADPGSAAIDQVRPRGHGGSGVQDPAARTGGAGVQVHRRRHPLAVRAAGPRTASGPAFPLPGSLR